MDEFRFENVFIDGTLIEVNANRYTYVWKRAVNKNANQSMKRQKPLGQGNQPV
jgi:hypothetical protein